MYLIFYSIQATNVVSHEQTYAHIDMPWKESIITIIILSTFLVTFGFVARKLKHITHTHTQEMLTTMMMFMAARVVVKVLDLT